MIDLLQRRQIGIHPLVIGELAVGNLKDRDRTLLRLSRLRRMQEATHAEALKFLEAHRLWGYGVSYIDLHLIASAKLTPGGRLWTNDRRLAACAETLGLAIAPIGSA